MQKRRLGVTELDTTVLGYGAMAIRNSSGDEAERVLNAVLDGGINFIDTAPDYGLSEEHIGRFIAHRRGEYFLATKCGCNVGRPRSAGAGTPAEEKHIWTRDMLLHNIEHSLGRLATDYVDVWQMHNPLPEQVRSGELVRVMEDVKKQGKVRHIGISSTLPHITNFINQGVFETFQIPYSALTRAEEHSVTEAAESGAGTIIRGGVAKGEPAGPLSEHQRWAAWEQAGLEELRADGESRSAFLLRFTITHPHLHTTIVGTRNLEHLSENLEAVRSGPLLADLRDQAKERLDAAGQNPIRAGT